MADEEKTYKFIVLPGKTFNEGTDEALAEGDTVDLTIEQALPFTDKLAPKAQIPGWKKLLAEYKANLK